MLLQVRRTSALALVVLALGSAAGAASGVAAQTQAATAAASPSEKAQAKRALALLKRGQNLQASRLFEALVRLRPEKALYWFNLGNARFNLNRYDDAASAYGKVIELRSPLSPVARLYQAKSWRKQGRSELAYAALLSIQSETLPAAVRADVQSERADLQDGFLKSAISHYQGALYRASWNELARAGSLSTSDTPPETTEQIRTMRALCLLHLSHPKQAKELLQNVASSTKSASLRSDSTWILQAIERDEDSANTMPRTWLYLDLSGGYNSNVFGVGDLSTGEGKPTTAFLASGAYRFLDSGATQARVGYTFSWDETLGLPGLRLLKNMIFVQGASRTGSLLVTWEPALEHQFFGANPYLFRAGASVRFSPSKSADDEPVVSLRYFHNSALGDLYPFLSGGSASANFSWKMKRRLNSGPWILAPFLGFVSDSAGDIPEPDGAVPLSDVGGGAGFLSSMALGGKWSFELTASYLLLHYTYLAEDVGGPARNDRRLSLGARLEREFRPGFSVYIAPEYVANSSSLNESADLDQNFTQFIGQIGLSWSLLP